jgi:hypothetical protein
MLSHEDQRRLAAIEQQLTAEDPGMAGRFAEHRSAGQTARIAAVLILGSLCLLATIVGLLPGSVLLAVLVALPIMGIMYLVLRRAWRSLH